MKQAIRNDEDARAYLLATDRAAVLEAYLVETSNGPRLRFPAPCGRCGGAGRGSWFQDGGICYECRGADTRNRTRTTTLKAYAQAEKRKDTAQAKKAAQLEADRAARLASSQAFLAERPELAAALKVEAPILADMAERLERFGALSDAQVALALKVAGELEARAAAPKAACPSGRVEVQGVLASVKWRESQFGGAWKAVVVVETPEGSWRAWGTLPAAVVDAALEAGLAVDALRGRLVRFTATVEPSTDEADFGFFKRPSKAELLPAEAA